MSTPDEPTVIKCRDTIIIGECSLHHEIVKGCLCFGIAVKEDKCVLIVSIEEGGALHPIKCIQLQIIPYITGERPS